MTALLCALVIMTCAVLPAVSASAESGGDALTVGVPTDRCPIFYRDEETDELVGIGVDLMRAAAEAAGYSVTFEAIEEATLKDALDSDAYDVLMPFGSPITSAAGRASIVSDNLTQTPFTLVTEGRRDLPPMNELRVGMLYSLSGAAETVRQLYPGMEITLYDTVPSCVKALRAGEVNALLHNSYVWSYVLQKPSYSDLKVQPEAMFSMDFRAGTLDTPEGRAILERLNGGIAALTDTRRQAITLDYTSRQLYRYDFSDYLSRYGLVLLLVVLLAASVTVSALFRRRTHRLEQEEKLRRLIDHDPLTGVYSLNGFRKRVEELIRTGQDIPYMIAYANIKNFKFINDSLGMESGDELLRFWTQKTQDTLSDIEAVCRIEGDHIAVFRRLLSEDEIFTNDQNVINLLRNYYIERGKEIRVQVCTGIYVLMPEDYRQIDVDHMLDYARVAEKRVRQTRADGFEFYNPEQWEKGKRVAEVVNHLPTALEAGDIFVWYQPQVEFETGKTIGAEALCRWDHSKLGWLRPADFIPTLEESGLIYDLDSFVWDRVCRDLSRWNAEGKHRSVSVNVSRCDIREDRDLPGHFLELTRRYGLTPDQIRVEITESAYVENPEVLIRTTEKLREYGFQVEMDDFGSGYSSLHMLKEVPVDRIKMDLHFLTDSGDPEKGSVIVSHMIRMVRELGMHLIAEGVETAEQAQFLHSCGCSEMQGYYFYKPMPVEEFEKLG